MRILFATAHPYPPEIAGGAQSSMHEMAEALMARGHAVAVLSGLAGAGWAGLRRRLALRLGQRSTVRDEGRGYPVFRAWFAWEGVHEVIAQFAPDVAVPHSGLPVRMSNAFARAGLPTAIYFRNVEEDDFGGSPQGAADQYIANSQFTRAHLERRFGISAAVLPPLFDSGRYRTRSTGRYVTFVNPHPHKGRDLAFALARACPDIEFLFVRAWTLDDEDERELRRIAQECPNVTVEESTSDMRTIYARTRVALMPSKWQEAWGRIATEAHFSGVPVLATGIGGLPESVGPGGVLLPPEAGVDEWIRALRSLTDDPDRYRAVSQAALAYSARPELDRETQLDRFEHCLEQAISRHEVRRRQAS